MNASGLRRTALAWHAQGRPTVVVCVQRAAGSVPREAGTRMLVQAGCEAGTIGGGHLEWRALAHARQALDGPAGAAIDDLHLPLGPALGQCCGGAVTLCFEWLDAQVLQSWPQPVPLFHLQMHGAGHVGQAIARLLEPLDVQVDWIDERDAAFPADSGPEHIRRLAVDAVEDEVRHAPPGAFFLVLTHSHELDLRLCERILRRPDAGWLGLIGSATKRARFERRLLERGAPAQAVARMACPIGLPGLTGKAPEVVAVAVVAQLLMLGSARAGVAEACAALAPSG